MNKPDNDLSLPCIVPAVARLVNPFNPVSFSVIPLFLFLSLIILLLAAGAASADQYHYTNALIGDRASGMGTAYTAIADDATGLYYNPAGIVYASGKNISASVNAYYGFVKSYKGVIGGRDWDRKSSALLPNYFGVVQPMGNFKIGFSYAVPDTIREDQDQVFTQPNTTVDRYVIDFNNEDNTYNFGPSIAMELRDDLAIGATLYFHQRRNQMVMNQMLNMNDGTNQWTLQYFETNEKGLKPILGVMWSPIKKLSLGATLSKTILYDAVSTGQTFCSNSSAGGCDNDPTTVDSFYPTLAYAVPGMTNEKKKYPTVMTFGAAYFASDELLVSADIKYYSKVTDAYWGNKEAVMNLSVGAEYFVNSGTAVRAGLFTDMANTPDVVSGGFGQAEHVDLYGISTSISSFTKNTSVSLGGSYFMGDGKAQIAGKDPVTGIQPVQNVEATGWTLFLSSSYSY